MSILALTVPTVDQALGTWVNNPHHNAIFDPFWTKASPCMQTIHQNAAQDQIAAPKDQWLPNVPGFSHEREVQHNIYKTKIC